MNPMQASIRRSQSGQRWLQVCVALAFGIAVFAQGGEIYSGDSDMKQFISELPANEHEIARQAFELARFNIAVSIFKRQGALDPSSISTDNLDSNAFIHWQMLVKEFDSVVWGDFFTGAMLIPGPWSSNAAVSFLYNPWWDTMMQLTLKYDQNDVCQITGLQLVSGEDFRGEEASAQASLEPVIPSKGTLAAAWFELVAKTNAEIEDKFEKASPDTVSFSSKIPENSLKPMVSRAALRLSLLREAFGNPGVAEEMLAYTQLLRQATSEEMSGVFQGEEQRKMFELFENLGPEFRASITPYGYWGRENDRVYLFVCLELPRIACLVYVHVGRDIDFEWFDLNDSQKYLELLRQAKEAK